MRSSLACLLAAATLTAGCAAPPSPLVTVSVIGPHDGAARFQVELWLDQGDVIVHTLAIQRTQFAVEYARGSRGTFSTQVDANDDRGCTLWRAYGSIELERDADHELTVALAKVDPPDCPR
jgi:hypothetical protein